MKSFYEKHKMIILAVVFIILSSIWLAFTLPMMKDNVKKTIDYIKK